MNVRTNGHAKVTQPVWHLAWPVREDGRKRTSRLGGRHTAVTPAASEDGGSCEMSMFGEDKESEYGHVKKVGRPRARPRRAPDPRPNPTIQIQISLTTKNEPAP